jgi:hypothetical protein
MLFSIPCRERGLSVGAVLIAISTLITNRVQSDHNRRGVVELFYRADLAVQCADIRITLADNTSVCATQAAVALTGDGRANE